MIDGADNFLCGLAVGLLLGHYVFKWFIHEALRRGKLLVMPDD